MTPQLPVIPQNRTLTYANPLPPQQPYFQTAAITIKPYQAHPLAIPPCYHTLQLELPAISTLPQPRYLGSGPEQPPSTTPQASNTATQTNTSTEQPSQHDTDFPYPVPHQIMVSALTLGYDEHPSISCHWLIDISASNHFTANKNQLLRFRLVPPEIICTGNGNITARGIGDIVVTLPSPFGFTIIQDIMSVPELQDFSNLLSIPQFTKCGFAILFTDTFVDIYRQNLLIAVGSKIGNGFYLYEIRQLRSHTPVTEVSRPHIAMLHGTTDMQPMDVWHCRLGHLNKDAIMKLHSISTGLNIGPAKDMTISMRCDSCLKSSQHKQISRIMCEPPANKLGCVHIDIKAPCLGKDIYGVDGE